MATTATDSLGQATRLDEIGGRIDPWLLGSAVALACLGWEDLKKAGGRFKLAA